MRRSGRRVPTALAALLVMGLMAACAGPADTPGSGQAAFPTDRVAGLVAGVAQRDGKDLTTARLAAGLVPPTNRWFSGLVFGARPQPVYPLPTSFALSATGFSFGLPTLTTTPRTIMGSHTPDVTVDLGAGVDWRVSGYDELGVSIEARRGATLVGTVHLVQGSPFISYSSATPHQVRLSTSFGAEGQDRSATVGRTTYGLTTDAATVNGATLDLGTGGRATWFPVATGATVQGMARLAADPVTETSAAYRVDQRSVTTTLHYATHDGGATAFATLPHQRAGLDHGMACGLGTYASIFGEMTLCSGHDLTWTTPRDAARAGLDLAALSDGEKQELRQSLTVDVAASKSYPADTYFGGKALYRDAMLLQIARQLGANEQADRLKERVAGQLRRWTDPQGCIRRDSFCFTYDTRNRGVVGMTPSFGSDEYNDHHFHYGYFLYAAGVVAAGDRDLASQLTPVMDLLAADIASSEQTDRFPRRRTFDAYASHSWASGTAPFADGNNQESSSEAVTAWAGLTLWARASHNSGLEQQSTWMQALEASSATAYWTDFDRAAAPYQGFQHQVIPLNFGGKRDYATWFSPEPAAALSILLLPMSPSSDHLAADPRRIMDNLAEATATKGYQQQYGDYLLMYRSLAGRAEQQSALAAARRLPAQFIDDGDSRTYLLAFIMSR
ncbi:glycosyl hydrolase [Raineyella fluvialis]|uniref:glucan endo-1,3-beta-D-glucosidase n=1 Tax=Raineyella fluvialis TaxID=2662261 RepID=A0A5Q2FAN1_9ACTN|nr:glycosyl hydrolase [Raineyella fluvialis]QGF23859.1 1,3-beta-glucanase [Raineyella fluvialis]